MDVFEKDEIRKWGKTESAVSIEFFNMPYIPVMYRWHERFKASEIICYSDLWAYFGIRDINYCGMQVAPGLFNLVDLPDLQGLIAPRPLLVDIWVYDSCFKVDTAMVCYKRVEKIYRAAGVPEHLELLREW